MTTLNTPRPARPSRASSQKAETRLNKIVVFLILTTLAIIVVGIPMGWMLTTALKPRNQIFAWPPVLWPDPPRIENFSETLAAVPLLRFAGNTLIICALNIVGRILSCSVVAFAFARLRFPGRNLMFGVLLSTLMIPQQMILIPQFALFKTAGLVDVLSGYLPLVLPSFFGNAFFVFLMRQYIMTIPRELDEAARIDGASTWGVFRRIILPLCKPPLVVITVLTFLWTWNEFMHPLIYITQFDSYTLQLGLNMLKGRFNIQWNLIMAGSLMAVVPCVIVYFLTQRHIIGGIANVGIKG
ncbi:MAG: carbohydrate ABC transporter permease [Thermoflexales bacterium]|nr:carbohydrate ABC transporter permease [Thermoflexales bacterium]